MTVRPLFLLAAAIICQQGTAAAQLAIKPAATAAPATQSVSAEETSTSITIPSGTTVLMTLRSPLNTVSARGGAGLYLETVGDVIQQNRIVIPAKTLVQGVVAQGSRPGRVRGRGHLQFHFTTLVLPSNYTTSIAGSLQSLPGSRLYEHTKHEGAIQPVDQIDKDAAVMVSSVATGAAIGSISRGAFGPGTGALIGLGFGLGRVLFKRGDDISLPVGTPFEMVLDRSLTIPVGALALFDDRIEAPIMKQTSPDVPRDGKPSPRFDNAVNLALQPAGTPEFRFEW